MRKRFNRKGIFILSAFIFMEIGFVFCSFAWDTARLMYYKVHNQNLASAIAISIVNESGYYLSDSQGESGDNSGKGYLVTSYYSNGVKPDGFSGEFADDPYLPYVIRDKEDIKGNDFRLSGFSINDNYTDMHRFIVGDNGLNGEVKVSTTLEVDMFFYNIGSLFGLADSAQKMYVTNVAVAEAKYRSTSTSSIVDWNNVQIFEQYYSSAQ